MHQHVVQFTYQDYLHIDKIITIKNGDRADGIATICEIKYSKDDYTVSENEYRKIIRRVNAFQEETNYKGGIQISLVTTYGIKDNMYSEISDIPITMNELFE